MDLINNVTTKTRQVDLIAAINQVIDVANMVIRESNMCEVLEAPMDFGVPDASADAPADAPADASADAPAPDAPAPVKSGKAAAKTAPANPFGGSK